MRAASLDLGTNTYRLLIADVDGGEVRELAKEQIITRLGGGYDPRANLLSEEAMGRALGALKKFASIINEHKPESVWAAATEIVRRAHNGAYFRELVGRETGIEIDVIAPEVEAALAFSGIRAYIPSHVESPFVTLDVGGGSTEWVAGGRSGPMTGWLSLPLGVVDLAEKVISGDPPGEDSLKRAESIIRDAAGKVPDALNLPGPAGVVVGTGGTATSLAVLHMGLTEYYVERVQNHRVPLDKVSELERMLQKASFGERAKMFPLTGGREDVIIPGVMITRVTMELFGVKELLVSDAGLLEGLLLAAARKSKGGEL